MQYIYHSSAVQRLLFALLLILLSLVFDNLFTSLLPLVILGCGGGDGSGDGGGDGSGDVGGMGGAGSGESASACSCGDCVGGCCGGTTSTPFLYVWRDGKFHLENDVMFGKMRNFFPTSEIGRQAYEEGNIPGDLYRIQSPMEIVDGKLRFQIREIEPEESFLDSMSCLRVTYPKSAELFIDSSLSRYRAFEAKDVRNNKGISNISIRNTSEGTDLTPVLLIKEKQKETEQRIDSHTMKTGDTIEIRATKDVTKDGPLFLFLESYFRDWTAGEVMTFTPRTSVKSFLQQQVLSLQGADFARGLRIVSTTFIFLIIWSLSFFWFNSQVKDNGQNDSEANVLSAAWAIKTAQADAGGGRSLVIEYWAGSEYVHIDTLHPRYYRPTFDAIELPTKVIDPDGNIQLRVTATKRHKVTQIGLAMLEEQVATVERLSISKAYHSRMKKDFAETLNSPSSKEYVRTIPADSVDIEVAVPEVVLKNGTQSDYLVQMSGFYSPASENVQREAAGESGDWTSKLESDAREWLHNMQSLGTYS